MKLARVIGQVVSTIKHPDHEGYKLLLVVPVDSKGKPAGPSFMALDAAQAGTGDTVLVLEEGKGARQIMKSSTAPCEAMVVGVVDHYQIAGKRQVPDAWLEE
ncbi:MAG: hypothetical protein D6806_13665 [Deltaproteobacteria bacterium]|nr:MAG: hypothetical protein D6806_13665 [Deltaproteobacteria bacterium]